MKPFPREQRGLTLLVGMVMLLLLAIIAISTYNVGKGSLQIVGNMQQRNQVMAAAQEAIEEAVSTTRLYTTPANVLANPCNGVANTRCVDVNGDGTNDVTVTLTLSCIKTQTPTFTFPLSADDLKCAGTGVDPSTGKPKTTVCTDALWNIRAQAVDSVTQATLTVNEGVTVRMRDADVAANCP